MAAGSFNQDQVVQEDLLQKPMILIIIFVMLRKMQVALPIGLINPLMSAAATQITLVSRLKQLLARVEK